MNVAAGRVCSGLPASTLCCQGSCPPCKHCLLSVPGCRCLSWTAAWGRLGGCGTSPPPCGAAQATQRIRGMRLRSCNLVYLAAACSDGHVPASQQPPLLLLGLRHSCLSAHPCYQTASPLCPIAADPTASSCMLAPRNATHRMPSSSICCRTRHSSSGSISTLMLLSSVASSSTGCARSTLQRQGHRRAMAGRGCSTASWCPAIPLLRRGRDSGGVHGRMGARQACPKTLQPAPTNPLCSSHSKQT